MKLLTVTQILFVSALGNVKRTVRGIRVMILGCKWLKGNPVRKRATHRTTI